MQTEPEQWAVELARDWDIECRYCSEYEGNWQADFAAAIQRAFEERERKLREQRTCCKKCGFVPDFAG